VLKESYLSQISNNQSFQQLVRPFSSQDIIKDAEFCIRRDGILFNVDGYYHPLGKIIGTALYSPDSRGNKQIFGVTYRKTTLYPDTYEPIPYSERGKNFRKIDPELDQEKANAFPFTYEQILPTDEFVGHIPSEHAYRCASEQLIGDPSQMQADLEDLSHLLDVNLSSFAVGLTGALALGQINDYHDLDIVFHGDLKQNRELADKIRDLVLNEPDRRLSEGGKSWLIRFFNRNGASNGMLMCCFFGYRNLKDAPLQKFAMKIVESDLEINASVSDATHALYTPTVVLLHDVRTRHIEGRDTRERLPDNLPLIIYHTGTRGELNSNDRVWAHGTLVEIITPNISYPAIVVIEREGVRNETPPWPNYYLRQKI